MGEKVSWGLLKRVFYNFQRNHQIMPEQVIIKAETNSKEVEQNKTGESGVGVSELWMLLHGMFQCARSWTLKQDDT